MTSSDQARAVLRYCNKHATYNRYCTRVWYRYRYGGTRVPVHCPRVPVHVCALEYVHVYVRVHAGIAMHLLQYGIQKTYVSVACMLPYHCMPANGMEILFYRHAHYGIIPVATWYGASRY